MDFGRSTFDFGPQAIDISVGTSVQWNNDGPSAHTVTPDDAAFEGGTLLSGDTLSVTFTVPGVYAYHCEIHPTMRGVVTVN